MVRRLHESIEDDANRLLDEISRLAFEVSEDVGEFAQSEDVFTELQYNSSSFERTELIRNYLNKILDLMAATKAAIPEDGEY